MTRSAPRTTDLEQRRERDPLVIRSSVWLAFLFIFCLILLPCGTEPEESQKPEESDSSFMSGKKSKKCQEAQE